MRDTIRDQLDRTLRSTNLDRFGEKYTGKVRDTYAYGDQLILVTTDRISAFDHVLRQTIPFKGQVLNRLAAYFFEATSDVVDNHVISVPDPNVTIATRCDTVPVEFVVRGYLVGHAWRTYSNGKRELCGISLADGLQRDQKFEQPILTPSTKAVEGHDEDISREEIVARGILSEQDFDRLAGHAFALFERGSQMASDRGLILVDTKYEFGLTPGGDYILIDEVHTPDSSRYFYGDTYEALLADGGKQRQLSKEFVREWLMDHGFMGRAGQTLPDLDAETRIDIAARYIELFDKVTGTEFIPDTSENPEARMTENLKSALSAAGQSKY
ncbi:MAG: phosphoribosylaminoimidazolesuccinocarboxamide synthase [Rhodothermales bacterium]|nr:phosphoribosylaminoimidazolesuccinocarboxamide synthase [Rhodothermales bacterium]